MTTATHPHSSKIYDQFALMDQLGAIGSSQTMLVLRTLLNYGTLGEGVLAAKIGSRTFRPEWAPLINNVFAMGYVSFTPTGRGVARTVSLTDAAKDFLAERGIIVEVEQPTEKVAG